MIVRETTAARVNALLNDPSVRPFAADPMLGELDATAVLADPRNVVLMGEHGGVLFRFVMHGIYEGHAQARPEGRGPWMQQASAECLRYMFVGTDAYEITTRVNAGNLAARTLALSLGMTHDFVVPNGSRWQGRQQDVNIHSLTITRWVQIAPGLEDQALWLLDALDIDLKELEADETQMRYLGAAAMMLRAGQIAKGAALYSRWAVSARQEGIARMARDQAVLRFRGVVFSVEGWNVTVLSQC